MIFIENIYKLIFDNLHGNIIIKILRCRYYWLYYKVKIDLGVEIWDKKNKILGEGTWIRKGVIIQDGKLNIGKNVNIGPYSTIFPGNGIKIGNNVLIGPNVGIYAGQHITKNSKINNKEVKGIIIKNDVWIGAQVVIMDGITIREGTIVGAGTIVTKSTHKYSVIVGNPGKQIK